MEDLKMVLSKYDTDGDGELDKDEFKRMMAESSEGLQKDSEKELLEAFKIFDKDGDGTVSWEEIYKTLQALGQDVSEQACKMMIESVDDDKNGTIDFDEFKKMMMDGPPKIDV